jgi:hypothetical protein
MESLHLRWRVIGVEKVTQIVRATHFAAVHNFAHDLDQLYKIAIVDDHTPQRFAGRPRESYA